MCNRHRRVAHALCFVALIASFTAARDTANSKDAARELHYVVDAQAIDPARLLPAPPKMDTQEASADLEAVLRVQEQRTDAEVARAQSENKLTMNAFTAVLGDWFTAVNLPLTAKLIESAAADSKHFSEPAKAHFHRPRPPHDSRIKPVIQGEDEPSYPSGHATRGILFASIIAELDPEHRESLFDRGREIGWDRVIAGVHYPSDLVAGRVLGQALFDAMLKSPEFNKDLAAAKAEFTAMKDRRGSQ